MASHSRYAVLKQVPPVKIVCLKQANQRRDLMNKYD